MKPETLNMKHIIVLGAGMVGSAMAIDLSKKYDATAVDINDDALQYLKSNSNAKTIKCDLSNQKLVKDLIKEFDIVLSAVPGFMGYETLKTIINARKDVVDISFLSEDVLSLNDLALKNNVTAIVDCGVCPGMSNIILGYYNEKMKITRYECFVGGLPVERIFPFEYKAPFSPVDVIEEYIRPARYIENGHVVIKAAMSDTELIDFNEIGTLEAFNTDGLRSILFTMKHIPYMKEKTLRYPGHIRLIQALFAAGFFDKTPVNVNGVSVKPFDLTLKILFDQWKLKPDEEEFTVLKLKITGISRDITRDVQVQKTIVYDMLDRYCRKTNTSSMARTTGYTATAAIDLILSGKFSNKGVFPPELVGKYPECFNHFINYLNDRDIIYRLSES
jgi:lysine 6-dehydrogenase